MCASSNMSIYSIMMTKLEFSGNLVMLQPGSSQLLNEIEDFITKYEVDQSSLKSPNFIVFHYNLEGDVDMAHYATANALVNKKIKISNYILFSLKKNF